MTLSEAISALNEACVEKIDFGPTRDGRVRARLPRVGEEIIIEGSTVNPDVKVGPRDLALLYEEARLAMAPALAVMKAAGSVLRTIEK